MREQLSERQKEVYDFICEYTKKNLFPPTFREIDNNTKTGGMGEVHRIIRILERKGYIVTQKDSPRAIRLVGYQLSELGG